MQNALLQPLLTTSKYIILNHSELSAALQPASWKQETKKTQSLYKSFP